MSETPLTTGSKINAPGFTLKEREKAGKYVFNESKEEETTCKFVALELKVPEEITL